MSNTDFSVLRRCVPTRRAAVAITLALAGVLGGGPHQATSQQTPAPAPALPGTPAPAETTEIQRALAAAIARFEARDAAGVLAHVSEQYRTSPMTKPALREQLAALFGLYDTVRARIRIDEVRMVGEQAWVYSTGEVTGRLALLGRWTPILSWERELEVARREDGRWRLYGYQQ